MSTTHYFNGRGLIPAACGYIKVPQRVDNVGLQFPALIQIKLRHYREPSWATSHYDSTNKNTADRSQVVHQTQWKQVFFLLCVWTGYGNLGGGAGYKPGEGHRTSFCSYFFLLAPCLTEEDHVWYTSLTSDCPLRIPTSKLLTLCQQNPALSQKCDFKFSNLNIQLTFHILCNILYILYP